MTDPTLDTLLGRLDALAATSFPHAALAERAAKAIREMREDLKKYGWHSGSCDFFMEALPCTCGLDSARARWGVR